MRVDNFWRENDEPGRRGIREIRHIEGLYAFGDYLLKRFHETIVDNCASGDRRIDFESIKYNYYSENGSNRRNNNPPNGNRYYQLLISICRSIILEKIPF